jgi:hypothetical protein
MLRVIPGEVMSSPDVLIIVLEKPMLNEKLIAKLQKSLAKGGWTYVV